LDLPIARKFKSLKVKKLDPRSLAGMTERIGSPLVGGDDKEGYVTGMTKGMRFRIFLVIPAKAGIQSPLPRKA